MAGILDTVAAGASFSEEEWAARHRWIMVLLWLHVPGTVAFALLRATAPGHAVLHAAIVATFAAVAQWASWGRAARSAVSALGLVAASAVLVHISGGAIEAHFHFFVTIAVLSLYQDWVPFLAAVGFVLAHHGVVGTVAPNAVFDHAAARRSPWAWAGVHAAFLLSASVVNVVTWRKNEQARRAALDSYRRLRESEERFRSHFADAAVGQAMALPDLTLLAGNAAFSRICGYEEGELRGLRLLDITHPDDRQHNMTQLSRLLSGEVASFDIEKRMLRRDGGVVHVLASVSAVRDDEGETAFLTAVIQDLTSRRQAEEATRRAEARFRDLVEAAPVAVVEYELDGRVSLWNPEAERMFGWLAEEVLGRPSPTIPVDREAEFDAVRRRVAAGESREFETGRCRRDGSEVHVAVSSAPVYDDDGRMTGMLSVIRDIGERRRLEEGLRQAQKMEALGRLAGGVAHDFNNLLTVISGYCALMRQELETVDAKPVAAYLCLVEEASERAARLTAQLLTFSRRQPLAIEAVDVSQLAVSLEEMLNRLLGDNVVLVTRLETLGAIVGADRSRLEQVVVNLVLNARDAMPEGGSVTIEVTVVTDLLATRTPGKCVALSVSDTGEGMDDSTRGRVFEPFFTTKKTGAGTGLGLATVYAVVEEAGGSVSVTSELGVGSTFTVLLPTIPAPSGTPEAARATRDEEEMPVERHGATILVVEDLGEVRSLACAVLEKQGYSVLAAKDAAEASALVASHSGAVDLLLTDVCLPDQSGSQLAARLVAERAGLRVLFMSGFAPEFGEGCGQLLEKPFRPDELIRRVDEVLATAPSLALPHL
ncbi:MAG: PAS domain S-box protein [Actinomycetota bacterium]|nr:PAS domain S-box protein [Actinomycetota bacterium]